MLMTMYVTVFFLTALMQFEMDEWTSDSGIESGFSSDLESISSINYQFQEKNGRKSALL